MVAPKSAFARTAEEQDKTYHVISFSQALASISDADVLTNYPLDFAGKVHALRVITTTLASTADKATTLTVDINATAVAGISAALTTANQGTEGVVLESTATAASSTREFTAADTISVVAASTTAFIEGVATIQLVLEREG